MADLFDVSSEVVVVTGASQGIGRRFAQTLAARGAAVILAARQTGKLEDLAAEIRADGGRAVAVAMDVTDAASIRTALDGGEAAFGPVTVLVNNAGVARTKLALDTSDEDLDALIATNLKGVYRCATEVARRMIARGKGGNIVNTASVMSSVVVSQLSAYSATKAAVLSMTKTFALEWAAKQIRVNAIAPGYIHTDMNDEFWKSPASEKLLKRIPQRRQGQPADLDGAIVFLASPASRYMTGTVITVDGGFMLT
jgi:3-oxoacyl-[acyl-carrier protein] reductase